MSNLESKSPCRRLTLIVALFALSASAVTDQSLRAFAGDNDGVVVADGSYLTGEPNDSGEASPNFAGLPPRPEVIVGNYPDNLCDGKRDDGSFGPVGDFSRGPNAGSPIARGTSWDAPEPGSVLWRAREWYRQNVRYCVSASWQQANLGMFRMDCSGFVSMAWNMPTVLSTSGFLGDDGKPYVTFPAWAELKPGDALIKSGHVRLFTGWVAGTTLGADGKPTNLDAAKPFFVEEPSYSNGTGRVTTGSSKTVKDLIAQGYKPMRYKQASDAPYDVTLTASSGLLGSAGGSVTLTAGAGNSTSIRISQTGGPALPGFPQTFSGSTATKVVAIPANSGTTMTAYAFAATATNSTGSVTATTAVSVKPPQPTLNSFVASYGGTTGTALSLPPSGGAVFVAATTAYTSSIVFDSVSLGSRSSTISAGAASATYLVPANVGSTTITHTVSALLTNGSGTIRAGSISIVVPPPPPTVSGFVAEYSDAQGVHSGRMVTGSSLGGSFVIKAQFLHTSTATLVSPTYIDGLASWLMPAPLTSTSRTVNLPPNNSGVDISYDFYFFFGNQTSGTLNTPDSVNVKITIPKNPAPTVTGPSSTMIMENLGADNFVASFTAADAEGELTTLDLGSPTPYFKMVGNHLLTTDVPINVETGQVVIPVEVRARDARGVLSTTTVISVSVQNGSVDLVPPGARYQSLPQSQRLMDSRYLVGAPGKFTANLPVRLPVAGGSTGVPAAYQTDTGTATTSGVSVVLNLTTTGAESNGFITVYPDGSNRPLASNLNYTSASAVANLVVVPVGMEDRITIVASSNVHVIIDQVGYFAPPLADQSDGRFHAMDATRIYSQAAVAGDLAIDLRTAATQRVPASAAIAVINLGITSRGVSGFLTAYPSLSTPPSTSVVNIGSTTGGTAQNLAFVPIGADGRIIVRTGSGVPNQAFGVTVDLVGWLGDASDTGGGLFYAQQALRTVDTRIAVGATGPLAAGGVIGLPLGVPRTAAPVAVLVNATNVRPNAAAGLTLFAADVAAPTFASTQGVVGTAAANAVIVRTAPSGVKLKHNPGGHVVADIVGWFG